MAAEEALDQPGGAGVISSTASALLAELPRRPVAVGAGVEALGEPEVALAAGGEPEVAADARDAEDAGHVVAVVVAADDVPLPPWK